MIDIDYDLIPIEPAQLERISRDAHILARRGRLPPGAREGGGRLVVVNPFQGYTLHHIPDDLRRPLRRVLQPVADGSRPLPPGELLRAIEEGEEPLHTVLLELHSDFPELPGFVARLAGLRRRHPGCRFMLHGELPRVHALLTELLAGEGTACTLWLHAHDAPVTLARPEDLAGVSTQLPRYPTFPDVFFESLRIRVGQRSETYTLAGLKRLYRQFGVGHVEELDVTGKMRERLLTLDIPVEAIESVRFAADKGEAFHAIRYLEEKMYAPHFAEKGLEGADVPFGQIEAFYRRMPGRDEEEIRMADVRALRVNCFEGHVSFLWKPTPEFLPLYEVTALAVERPGGDDGEDGGGPLEFDAVVVTERDRPRFGDVRAGVRRLFLTRFYTETLTRQAKLRAYASGLRIACLGPLAAQTLKLLKPFGLSRAVPVEQPYYLGDSVKQIPEYPRLPAMLAERHDALVDSLRSLVAGEPSAAFDPEQVLHRLPVTMRWSRGEAPAYEAATAEDFSSVYNELRVFMKFAESMFRRIDHRGMDDVAFFGRLERCREASLQAKQLANLKNGSYGRLLGEGEAPDFVFFSTERDAARNRERYFLPGLAWARVFAGTGTALSWEEDYAYNVFLEEQLSIIDSLWRQEFMEHPGPAYYRDYFQQRVETHQRELGELHRIADEGEIAGSEPYAEAIRRLEEGHAADIVEFEQELEQEAGRLEAAEQRYFEALRTVNEALGHPEMPPEVLLNSEDYVLALDKLLAKRSVELLGRLRAAIGRIVDAVNQDLRERREDLKGYLQAFHRMQHAAVPRLEAHARRERAERLEAATPQLLAQIQELQRAPEEEAARAEAHLARRQERLAGQGDRLEREIRALEQRGQAHLSRLREQLGRVLTSFALPARGDQGDSAPLRQIDAIEATLRHARDELRGIIQQAHAEWHNIGEALERAFVRRLDQETEAFIAANEAAVLAERRKRSRLRRLVERRIGELPVPFHPPPPSDPDGAWEQEYRLSEAEWQRLGNRLYGAGQVERYLGEVQGPVAEHQQVQRAYAAFRRAVLDKRERQRSVERIRGLLGNLRAERADLPRLIRERMLPSYRQLCRHYLIPLESDRLNANLRARDFVQEVERLSFDHIQREFMERAVFRRFQSRQFRRGAYYGQNPDHPLFAHLSNVLPALYDFHREARHNLVRQGVPARDVVLTKLSMATPEAVKHFCEQQRRLPAERRYSYLVLPGTLSLHEALDIILYKEAVFLGLPQLVLIYVSKFRDSEIRERPRVRQRYFLAAKHNLILNLDHPSMVDAPGPIAQRLVRETLGRCSDLGRVERAPELEGQPRSAPA